MRQKEKLCEMLDSQIPTEGGIFLRSATLYRASGLLELQFVVKQNVTAKLKEELEHSLQTILGANVSRIRFDVKRCYFDDQVLKERIRGYFVNRHPAVGACIDFAAMQVEESGQGAYRICLPVDEVTKKYITDRRLDFEIAELLYGEFFTEFALETDFRQVLPDAIPVELPEVTGPIRVENQRRIYCQNIEPIVGKPIEEPAYYIIDMERPLKNAVLCGRVTEKRYRLTKTEKHMFTFRLEDFTGSIYAMAFANSEDKLERLNALEEGAELLVSGELIEREQGGGLSYFVRNICTCRLPENFVPAPMPSRPAPADYTVVFPQPLERTNQEFLFAEEQTGMCDPLLEHTYVVFDTETTGLNYDLDKIIEIAAVKVVGGKLVESFTTLINPERSVPEAAQKVNNITDEMLYGKPLFKDVLPDFYKFTRGCQLVAHNIDFDIKFVQYAAKKEGYFFENPLNDTMLLSRELLKGLANHRQETVAEYFGVETGQKHRALDDTIACDEIFVKLMNIKYLKMEEQAG